MKPRRWNPARGPICTSTAAIATAAAAAGHRSSTCRFDLSLAKTSLIGSRPTQGTFGILGAEIIAPGDPYRSVLYYRISKLGHGRMPQFGSQSG